MRKKIKYQILDTDYKTFGMVEWAGKDGGSCKFYDLNDAHDTLEWMMLDRHYKKARVDYKKGVDGWMVLKDEKKILIPVDTW